MHVQNLHLRVVKIVIDCALKAILLTFKIEATGEWWSEVTMMMVVSWVFWLFCCECVFLWWEAVWWDKSVGPIRIWIEANTRWTRYYDEKIKQNSEKVARECDTKIDKPRFSEWERKIKMILKHQKQFFLIKRHYQMLNKQ